MVPQSSRPSSPLLRAAVRVAVPGAFLLLALAAACSQPAAQSKAPPVCNMETTECIVAVGDVHGAYDQFVGILRAAGLIDQQNRWSGGRTVFVQTGDVPHRGDGTRKAFDLLRQLERDAPKAGGRVHALLGNHEVMSMIGDWRYVSAGEYAAFTSVASAGLRERAFEAAAEVEAERAQRNRTRYDESSFRAQFEKQVPLGAVEMRQAFEPNGEYGRWLRTHDTVIRINGILFVHGGIDPAAAAMGCETINSTVRKEIAGGRPSSAAAAKMFASSDNGPLWYRGVSQEPEAAYAPSVTTALDRMGARAMVVGHTVALGRMATRFGGRVVMIDTGMLDGDIFPGGVASALEIRGETATAIYMDRREPVTLAQRATPAAAAAH